MNITLDLDTALKNAAAAERAYFATNPEPRNWFPCGFSWLSFRCRKNAKVSKTLIANGFRWEDYRKAYIRSSSTFSQSMYYTAAGLEVAAKSLEDAGFAGFYVDTRID